MRLFESVQVGIRMSIVEMLSHKLRSSLSVLGVLLGVASLVAMLTLIGGINRYLNEKISTWAGSVWFRPRNFSPETDGAEWSRSPGLRFSDGYYLEEHAPTVKSFAASIERWSRLTIAGVRSRARLTGMNIDVLQEQMEHIFMGEGRWFTERERRDGAKVCVLSWRVEERVREDLEDLGGTAANRPILGAMVLAEGIPLRVVGIYQPKDPDFTPWHLRRTVITPLQTMRTYITGLDPNPGDIEVKIRNIRNLEAEAEQAARILQTRHRGVRDFEFRAAEWIENITSMLQNAALLMGIVSAVSLMVGGLSIMNVMLSGISERIKEIGVRKALGATTSQVFVQFVAESVTLSMLGGLAGILPGLLPLAFSDAIKQSSDGAITPTVLPQHIVMVVLVIVAVGTVFGLYPAVKAARMDPVEALRYE